MYRERERETLMVLLCNLYQCLYSELNNNILIDIYTLLKNNNATCTCTLYSTVLLDKKSISSHLFF